MPEGKQERRSDIGSKVIAGVTIVVLALFLNFLIFQGTKGISMATENTKDIIRMDGQQTTILKNQDEMKTDIKTLLQR